jgi:hypothetical protein
VKKPLLALVPLVALLAAVAASAAAGASAQATCPASWRASWQKLANQIDAPVYCPSWLPQPLQGQIGSANPTSYGRFVERDRSYLIPFLWQETTPTGGEEVHVNLRGYPGRSRIPVCDDTVRVGSKVVHKPIPCFDDAREQKRIGNTKVTVYTVNQGADQWHILYAWHLRGSLYTLSEHVAPPFSVGRVVANLDRMMRGLELVRPAAVAG